MPSRWESSEEPGMSIRVRVRIRVRVIERQTEVGLGLLKDRVRVTHVPGSWESSEEPGMPVTVHSPLYLRTRPASAVTAITSMVWHVWFPLLIECRWPGHSQQKPHGHSQWIFKL